MVRVIFIYNQTLTEILRYILKVRFDNSRMEVFVMPE